MQQSSASSRQDVALPSAPGSRQSTLLHFLIVFGLGVVSAFCFSPASLDPWWLQPAIAFIVLLAAIFLSWLIERRRRQGADSVPGGQPVGGIILSAVLFCALGVAFLTTRQIVESAGASPEARQAVLLWAILGAGLIPILVGFVAALITQTRPSGGLAIGGAAVAWLGASVGNIIATIFTPILKPGAPNPEGVGVTLVIVIVLSVAGFALAALGGLLGWGLRAITKG